MAQIIKENLKNNLSVLAQNYVGDSGVNFFEYPQKFQSNMDYVEEQIDVSPVNTYYTRNGTSEYLFNLPVNRFDRLGKMQLLVTRPAITNATTSVIEDWEGCKMINVFRVFLNNETFFRITGEERLQNILDKSSRTERQMLARLMNGDLTYRERVVTTATAFPSTTPIVFDPAVSFAPLAKTINCYGLTSITVGVTFTTLANMTFNPGSEALSEAANSNAAVLRITVYHLPEKANKSNWARIQTEGIFAKILSTQSQIFSDVAVANTSATALMNTISGNVVALRSYLIPKQQWEVASTRNSSLFIAHCVNVKDNASTIMTSQLWGHTDAQRSRMVPTPAFHKIWTGWESNIDKFYTNSFTSSKIFFCHPKYWLASEHGCYGSRFLQGYSNPSLYIEPGYTGSATDPMSWVSGRQIWDGYPSNTGVADTNYRWWVVADVHNILIQRRGNIFCQLPLTN